MGPWRRVKGRGRFRWPRGRIPGGMLWKWRRAACDAAGHSEEPVDLEAPRSHCWIQIRVSQIFTFLYRWRLLCTPLSSLQPGVEQATCALSLPQRRATKLPPDEGVSEGDHLDDGSWAQEL